jgi:hypothetical protein
MIHFCYSILFKPNSILSFYFIHYPNLNLNLNLYSSYFNQHYSKKIHFLKSSLIKFYIITVNFKLYLIKILVLTKIKSNFYIVFKDYLLYFIIFRVQKKLIKQS